MGDALIDHASRTVGIDDDGDIDLECSFPGGAKPLRVSSRVLSMASPVFKRMFVSRFRESMDSSSGA